MKRSQLILSVLLAASTILGAQTGPPPITTSQVILPVYSSNLTPATQASTALAGNPGNQTVYYWMVSNSLLGSSSPVGPFVVTNAPNTLSGSNYVAFTPVYPSTILSIDLLKTSSMVPPTGACACAVSTGVTSGTINDQANSTGAYTVNPVNVLAFNLTLQNEVISAGVAHLILRQNGVFITDLSTSAGSGGTVTGVTAGTGLTGSPSTIVTTGTISLANALPNGETAATQAPGDNTAKVATDQFVLQNSGSGTVTNVATGAGLSGGPCLTTCTLSIPNLGVINAMLANPSLTVTAGTGLGGGGSIPLGGSATVSLLNALPNGETATTQTVGDNTTKVATDAFVLANAGGLNVNGSLVATPNFGNTPAAGANGINAAFQVSGSNISAEIVGNGNVLQFLNGTGAFSTPAGGGNLSGTLVAGQRLSAQNSTAIVPSGPIYDTTQIAGATVDARLHACLGALPSTGGACDMSAETALTTSTTVANGVISGNGVIVILPPVTTTLGNAFFFNITGNNSGFVCLQKWACVLDASNNGSAGTFTLAGTGDFVTQVKMIGGRLNKQTGNEVNITGTNDWFYYNWMVNAGQAAVTVTNNGATAEAQASVRYNIVDQSGSAAILINNSNNASSTTLNDVGYNLTRDANVNFNQNTQGTIGAGCSAGNCQASPPTAHLADHNSFHDNIILNQVLGSGDCNNPNFGTLAITSWTGNGTTVQLTYTSLQPSGGLPVVGQSITVAGVAAGVNGTNAISASTTTTVSFLNSTAGSASGLSGTITYTPLSTDTGCSEGIQTTDVVWYEQIKNNYISLASKEGIAFSGLGWQVTGNTCDGCGQHVIGGSTSGAIAWEKSTQVQASPGYVGAGILANNTITNTTPTTLRYGIQHLFTGTGSGPYTYQNVLVANNVIDGSGGSGGFTNGITLVTTNLTGGNVTFKNYRVTGNTISGNVTTPFQPNGYALITGRARLGGNGFNSSTDTAPVANDVVAFDANLQPELDTGLLYTNLVAGVVANQGLALSGNSVELIQTCSSTQVLAWNGSIWACAANGGNPMTTAGDLIVGGAAGAETRLPVNATAVPQTVVSVSGATSLALAGVPFDVQSGASPSVVTGDRAQVFQSTNNTTSTAVAVPQSGSAGFTGNFPFVHINTGSVIATDTPTTSNVNGNGTLKLQGAVAGHNPEVAFWWGDGNGSTGNWWAAEILPTDANGQLAPEGVAPASLTNAMLAGSIALSKLATQTPDTIVQNATGGSAAPTAVATPSGGTNGCSGVANAATYNNSTHAWGCNTVVTQLIASGTSAMGTGAITSGTCATVVTTTATGAATTDNLVANPTADPTGVTGYAVSATGSLYIQAYITSGNVNFKVCNNTSGSLTPAALTMQWRVMR